MAGLCVLSAVLLTVSVLSVNPVTAAVPAEVVYEWTTVEYLWPTPEGRAAAVSSGEFVPTDCVITGVKTYNGEVYVTVPRWRHGVPATLAKVVKDSAGNPLLDPYPSWEWNNATASLSALQYVQSMEIDNQGRMWILDVGRQNIFDNDTALIKNSAAKMVIWSIPENRLLSVFTFPNSVAPFNSSFLNDLAVDSVNEVAYISETGTVGAIVVFDLKTNSARKWSGDVSTQHNASYSFEINGVTYSEATNQDPIALSPDVQTLYFGPLNSNHLYSVPTQVLRNFSTTAADIHSQVSLVGLKPSCSDGMTMSNTGVLYFGAFSLNGVMAWDTSQPFSTASLLVSNNVTMQWQDTFAWDDSGSLYFTSNRLQLYFAYTMDWSGKSGANMRVWRLDVGQGSYLKGERSGALAVTATHAKALGIVPTVVPELAVSTALHVHFASPASQWTSVCGSGEVSHTAVSQSVDMTLADLPTWDSYATQLEPGVSWDDVDPTAVYHVFMVAPFNGSGTFLHSAKLNMVGGMDFAQVLASYMLPAPFSATPSVYAWLLYTTPATVPLSAQEQSAFLTAPLAARYEFSMARFAADKQLGTPIGFAAVSQLPSEFSALTWSNIANASWIPQDSRSAVSGNAAAACSSRTE